MKTDDNETDVTLLPVDFFPLLDGPSGPAYRTILKILKFNFSPSNSIFMIFKNFTSGTETARIVVTGRCYGSTGSPPTSHESQCSIDIITQGGSADVKAALPFAIYVHL